MSDAQPNGLASLTAQRERARRSMPPPRHPVTVMDPLAPSMTPQEDIPGNPEPLAAQPTSTIKVKPHRPVMSPAGSGATFKVTLYVDRETDEFMEAARIEGLTSRPKVDISRSAVVRLALRRLMDEMTPAEVKTLLEGQAVSNTGPGRKRR